MHISQNNCNTANQGLKFQQAEQLSVTIRTRRMKKMMLMTKKIFMKMKMTKRTKTKKKITELKMKKRKN